MTGPVVPLSRSPALLLYSVLPLKDKTNVLLFGNGGREHALAWKLRQSPRLGELWLADPPNAGLERLGRRPDEPLDMRNAFRMQRWCDRNAIDLVVIGPEAPLAAGLADALATPERLVFGPSQAAARLESDKGFAKQLMRSAGIPTAEARLFSDRSAARRHVETHDAPCVVKAVGLCAGKGVVVCDDAAEALEAIDRLMVRGEFGDAGRTILVEERLHGPEASVLALVDGHTIWVLDPCQDHKRLLDDDKGPNTGGMGAFCPAPILDEHAMEIVHREVLVAAVDALRREGIEYRGVLYAGLMLTPAGPKVLEFNCRFGDPECQVLLPRLQADLIELLWATCTGTLDSVRLDTDPRTACCVVMAAEGYPAALTKGAVIDGIEDALALADDDSDVIVFHGGTQRRGDGAVIVNGGRVLGVTALAPDLPSARSLALEAADRVRFDGAQYRRDVGAMGDASQPSSRNPSAPGPSHGSG